MWDYDDTTPYQTARLNIQDRALLRRFEQLDSMTEKELAKEILDLVILQHKFPELTDPGVTA